MFPTKDLYNYVKIKNNNNANMLARRIKNDLCHIEDPTSNICKDSELYGKLLNKL